MLRGRLQPERRRVALPQRVTLPQRVAWLQRVV
jgi:hypothetical protein